MGWPDSWHAVSSLISGFVVVDSGSVCAAVMGSALPPRWRVGMTTLPLRGLFFPQHCRFPRCWVSKATRSPNNLQFPILFRVGMTENTLFFLCVCVVKVKHPFLCCRAPRVHQLWVEKQALKLSEFIYSTFGDLVGLFSSKSCYWQNKNT